MSRITAVKEQNQVISIFYSPDLLTDTRTFEGLVREAKANHYGIVMGFVRHMKLNLFCPEVIRAVAMSARLCHKHGLKYTLEMDASHWGYHITERHPETAVFVCKKGEGRAFNGRFEVTLALPKIAVGVSQTTIRGLAAVYVDGKDGKPQFIEPASLKSYKEEYFLGMYGGKTYEEVQVHDFYRSGGGDSFVTVKGQLRSAYSGKVVVYAKFQDTSHVWVGHPRYLKAQRELLDCYQTIPLDGVGWDEAVRGSDGNSYKMGEGFFEQFRRERGYRLDERLIYLDGHPESPEAVRTRIDYYDALSSVNFRAQDEFNRYAKQLFGQKIILGIHQTWSGFVADLRAGCFPYFKMGKVLSDAYTDSCWMVPRDVIFQYYLSDSLRKEIGREKAYCNDWGGIETTALTEYYTRLKFLFKMNWVTMYMGIASEGLPNFPVVDIWPATGRCARLLDTAHAFIGGDLLPSADTAVWLGWEGIGYLNNFFVRLYQMAVSNLAQCCLDRNRHFDFVSSDAVDASRIEDGRVRIGKGRYRTLVMPYACALRRDTVEKIAEMARQGVRVIFFGPPLEWETDRRRNLNGEFGRWTGITPVSLRAFTEYYKEKKPVPDFATSWEPTTVDFIYPVSITTGKPLRDAEGRSIAVSKGRMTYMPCVDPREMLVDLLEAEDSSGIKQYSDTSYYRVYDSRTGHEWALAVVARMNRVLDSIIKIRGNELTVRNGRWAIIKFEKDRVVDCLCDDGVEISWNNKRQAGSGALRR